MKHEYFRRALRVSALLFFVVALRCVEEVEERTSLLLTIESRIEVSDVIIKVRNIDYVSHEISKSFGSRRLVEEPLVVLILPSSDIQTVFQIHVRGLLNGEQVGADATVLGFVENRQEELTLVITEFNDSDNDGFEACNNRDDCDCNDQNGRINPFTREACGDHLDNNCSGLPVDEGCPCTGPAFCTPLPEDFRHLAGIGMCYFGVLECVDGAYEEECEGGTVDPGAGEIPDNLLDDNCNGVVDEGSECTPGQTRACFLGWVEPFPGEPGADSYPPGIRFDYVFDTPGVTCQTGVQTCGATGRWEDSCVGEVRPQRATGDENAVGWVELPSNPSAGECGQCDGIDNDCNGQFDEEPWFDGDGDGYTYCGTNIDTMGNPQDPDSKLAGMNADFVDCDDSPETGANVNPGKVEICGNNVDEDCRCDHDTEIGEPYLLPPDPETCTRPAPTCSQTRAYLDCSHLPRSDSNPTGVCSDGSSAVCTDCEPYYQGYFGADRGCYLCREQFGLSCGPTGECTTQAEDCGVCDAPDPTGSADEPRPYCTTPGDGCEGTTPAEWEPIVGSDPFDDCPAVACSGYYAGIAGGECYEKATQLAGEVDCNGRETCEVAADLCPGETDAAAAPVAGDHARPVCQTAVSGCTDTTHPTYGVQANNSDMFSECNDSYTCDTGTPYYFGIGLDGNNDTQCFYRADVPDSFCNGAGACQARADACSTSGRGGVVPGRPICQEPTGGCTGTTGPTYSRITDSSDPYDDCPLSSDGSTDLTCNPNGGCYSDLGVSCGSSDECQLGWGCVNGVCCSASSCGECERCDVAGLEGNCEPWTGNNGVSCNDDCSHCVNGTCTPRAAGDFTECSSTCRACTTAGGNCGAWTGDEGTNCAGTTSFCCNGNCVTPGGEYDTACGSGDCSGGTWGCSGSNPRCSSYNNPCDYCSGDTQYDAACTGNFGATCTGTASACPACTSCVDQGDTTTCAATGGVNNYIANSTDSDGSSGAELCGDGTNNCGATNCRCDGTGNCDRAVGELCPGGAGECGTGICEDSYCCTGTCTDCNRCNVSGSEGTCTAWTGDNDGACNDDCSRCSSGSCVLRPAGDFTECSSECEVCTTAGGNCGAWTGTAGYGCTTTSSFCCSGTCVTPGGEYGATCGGGDCAGGTWGCSGASARCSSYNDPCDYCSGDTQYDASCTANFGAACATGTPTTCAACTSCVDQGDTTTCAATGGVNNYVANSTDSDGSSGAELCGDGTNNCGATNCRCDGTGNCDRAVGELCPGGAGECGTGICEDSYCCTGTCTDCNRCNVSGSEGTCTAWTGDNDGACNDDCSQCTAGSCVFRAAGDFAECSSECEACTTAGGNCGAWTGTAGYGCTTTSSFCCSGTCVTPGGEYGATCGGGDCAGGTWGCSGASARCSSYNDPCDYCSGDTQYDASCTANFGAACATGTPTTCAACTSCVDQGDTTTCAATGGVNSYTAYSEDTDGSLTCTGTDRCDGAGVCKLNDGEGTCGADADCVSDHCAGGICCPAGEYNCGGACVGDCNGDCGGLTRCPTSGVCVTNCLTAPCDQGCPGYCCDSGSTCGSGSCQ